MIVSIHPPLQVTSNEASMLLTEIERIGGVAIVLMDSIALIAPVHEGAVVVTGSHGGQSAGDYALKVPLRGVIFNDAGITGLEPVARIAWPNESSPGPSEPDSIRVVAF